MDGWTVCWSSVGWVEGREREGRKGDVKGEYKVLEAGDVVSCLFI